MLGKHVCRVLYQCLRRFVPHFLWLTSRSFYLVQCLLLVRYNRLAVSCSWIASRRKYSSTVLCTIGRQDGQTSQNLIIDYRAKVYFCLSVVPIFIKKCGTEKKTSWWLAITCVSQVDVSYPYDFFSEIQWNHSREDWRDISGVMAVFPHFLRDSARNSYSASYSLKTGTSTSTFG